MSIEESGALYPFQSRALENLLKRTTGVLEAPTGSGKTNILLSAVARLNTPSLILVHTSELLEQTCSRVRSWLGVEPGVIGGGKFELRPVTVAMVQTLARRDLEAEGIARYFGAVLVDEVHHSPAVTWAAILNHLPAKYRYGFTATAWRKDGLQFLIWQLIGSRTARITRAEVQAAGRIIWPEFESVETDYFYPITDASQWGEMISDLVANEDRNHLIEVEIRKRLSAASRALVLCDRISHAGRLAELLEDLGPILLTGESTKSERQGGMVRVRQGARLTVATTHLLGEGVDVPGWDLLFLVSPIAGGTKTLQCIGRVTRPAAGKHQSRVVDFVDVSVPMLSKAYRSRMRLYG